jgi:uncharacterized protein (DUF1778 family)
VDLNWRDVAVEPSTAGCAAEADLPYPSTLSANPASYTAFVLMLNAPPKANARLHRALHLLPPWPEG